MDKKIEEFKNEILNIHNKNIIAIYVYGSYVSKTNFILKKSDINILIIFDTLNFNMLNLILPITHKYKKKYNISILPLTQNYILESIDIFPVEFLDIQLNRKIIYGSDIIKTLEFTKDLIRLECEQQIKGTIIKLQGYFLEYGAEYKNLLSLITNSFKSLIPVFRSIIYLNCININDNNIEMISQLEKISVYEYSTFKFVIKLISGLEKLDKNKIFLFFENYLNQLSIISDFVNRLEPK